MAKATTAAAVATKPQIVEVPTEEPQEELSMPFDFEIDEGLEIPVEVPARATSAVELPFKDRFGKMKHGDHFFVPDTFWTAPREKGGREVDTTSKSWANLASAARTKIRDNFNTWRKGDEASRGDRWEVVFLRRSKGDEMAPGKVAPDNGWSVFLKDLKRQATPEG